MFKALRPLAILSRPIATRCRPTHAPRFPPPASHATPSSRSFRDAARPPPPPPPPSATRSYRRTMATAASGTPLLSQPVRLACIQLASGADKAANLAHARDKVLEAARAPNKADVVVLPECFNSPYGTAFFPKYAEPVPAVGSGPGAASEADSPSFVALSAMAREAGVYLIGGSIPERETATGKLFNTSLVFSPAGEHVATHRKVHLFDISIPGGITFRESEVLSAGGELTVVDVPPYGRVGLAICYDVRFPELATIAARRAGCFAMVYPGAFNMTTGPLHWSLLARARAVDNQFYVAMCSPARDEDAGYKAWGHSMVVDPMAKVLAEAGDKEETIVAELRWEEIAAARRGIPLETQRRFDVYPDVSR